MTAFLLFVVLLLLAVILWLLRRLAAGSGGSPGGGGQPSIPDNISGPDAAGHLSVRLMGTPADGSAPATGAAATKVVWVDAGDEVLVHLDAVTTQISNNCLLVSIDLETDQTGRTPLIVVFSLAQDATGGLIAATDEFPRGNGALAARWGILAQRAAWSALLSLAADHASERGAAPQALKISQGALVLAAGPPLKLAVSA